MKTKANKSKSPTKTYLDGMIKFRIFASVLKTKNYE